MGQLKDEETRKNKGRGENGFKEKEVGGGD